MRTIEVTRHALERWRQRASTYADDGIGSVVAAVRASRLCAKNESLPFNRRKGRTYRHSAEFRCYFVLDAKDAKKATVVTICPEQGPF